jgi:DNA-binding NarL/FixJ family response regulator
MSGEKIRIVIVDDQSLITQSFKVVLETLAEDIVVVGLAHDGAEAVTVVDREKPDVVLMDVRMPNMDGVEATRRIHRGGGAPRIIMLTTFDDDSYVSEAIRAGAVGYLLKDISTDELISSIRAAHHGAVLVSSALARKLIHKDGGTPDEDALAILGTLSRREAEILRLLAQGLENKEIADKLNVAEQTVKNNISALYTKLGVVNRKEARKLALKSGLLSVSDVLRPS